MSESVPDALGFGGTGTLNLCVDGVIKTTLCVQTLQEENRLYRSRDL